MDLCYGCTADDLMGNLIRIYSSYQADPALAALRAGGNPFVPGVGRVLNPRCVLIGEAPGRNEAEQRQPFVGQAGQLLDELLGSIGLKREEIFITNLVKYRPVVDGANRPPSKPEKAASLPYLRDEIMALKTRILVPLGAHALSVVMPDLRIGEAHGHLYAGPGRYRVVPLYHPAVALYNPTQKKVLLEDFRVLGKMLNG